MKVGIIGNKNYNNYSSFKQSLEDISRSARRGIRGLVITSDSTRINSMAEKYAAEKSIDCQKIRVDLSNPVSALHQRNTKLIEASDCIVAFWDGISKSTKLIIQHAKKSRYPKREVHIIKIG